MVTTNLVLISCKCGVNGDGFFVLVFQHHLLLPRCLDANCEWNIITFNSPPNMYTWLFVVELEMFMHPHAWRFCVVVVAFVCFYCEAASDIADVLLINEEVSGELLPSLARFHECFMCFPIIWGIDKPSRKWHMMNFRTYTERWLEYLLLWPIFMDPWQDIPGSHASYDGMLFLQMRAWGTIFSRHIHTGTPFVALIHGSSLMCVVLCDLFRLEHICLSRRVFVYCGTCPLQPLIYARHCHLGHIDNDTW